MFGEVLGRLKSPPLEAVADTLAFETIDAGTLAQRLQLVRNGEERGRQNSPPPDAETFDSIEHTILAEIEEYRRKAVDRLTRSLEAYAARLRAFDTATSAEALQWHPYPSEEAPETHLVGGQSVVAGKD